MDQKSPAPEFEPDKKPARAAPDLSRFIRFVAVGILNTGFGYGVFACVWFLTASHIVSVVVANLAGMTFNYFTIGRLVFGNKGLKAAVPFFATYGVILIVNLCVVEVLTRAGVGALVAQIICVPLLVGLSYALNSAFVFRQRRS